MPSIARCVLTIDLGTQSLRVSALDTAGQRLWTWSRAVESIVDGELFEQDPAHWRALLDEALGAATAAGVRPDVIVATGPLAGYVPLDAEGTPLANAVMYPDGRAAPDVQTTVQALARHPASDTMRLRVYGPDPLPQWLRLVRMQPQLAARTRSFLDCTGWINHYLTGAATLNHYTGLRLYDPAVRASACAADACFGRVVPLGEPVGELTAAHARRLGWKRVAVLSAPFDSKCAYIAAGLTEEGDALDISGTVTSIGARATGPVVDAARRIYSVPFDGAWLTRGSTASSGGVLEWARRELLGTDFAELDRLAADVAPGARGLLFLPYHTGERTPLWNPHARGALLGMGLDHGKADIARAVYEGIALSAMHVVQTMRECGVRLRSLRVAGGLARNDLLCRIKADALGIPVLKLSDSELTTLGLGVIGSVALGAYSSHAAASSAFVSVIDRIEPRPAFTARYAAVFERYAASARALAPTFVPSN